LFATAFTDITLDDFPVEQIQGMDSVVFDIGNYDWRLVDCFVNVVRQDHIYADETGTTWVNKFKRKDPLAPLTANNLVFSAKSSSAAASRVALGSATAPPPFSRP
jgi:hypothetical protein